MAQPDNAADSDSEDRGFESLRAGQKKHLRGSGDVFYGIRRRDSNPERVSGVKKTVRGTVFRREGRDGYCRIKRRSSRSEYAQHTHSSERAKKKHLRGSGDVRLSIKHLNHALKIRYVLLYQKKVFYRQFANIF